MEAEPEGPVFESLLPPLRGSLSRQLIQLSFDAKKNLLLDPDRCGTPVCIKPFDPCERLHNRS